MTDVRLQITEITISFFVSVRNTLYALIYTTSKNRSLSSGVGILQVSRLPNQR